MYAPVNLCNKESLLLIMMIIIIIIIIITIITVTITDKFREQCLLIN